jgi:hypothetical protein
VNGLWQGNPCPTKRSSQNKLRHRYAEKPADQKCDRWCQGNDQKRANIAMHETAPGLRRRYESETCPRSGARDQRLFPGGLCRRRQVGPLDFGSFCNCFRASIVAKEPGLHHDARLLETHNTSCINIRRKSLLFVVFFSMVVANFRLNNAPAGRCSESSVEAFGRCRFEIDLML